MSIIKIPVLYISSDWVKHYLEQMLETEIPFEITEQEMKDLVHEFQRKVEQDVSDDIDAYYESFENILIDTIYFELYGKTMDKMEELNNGTTE